MSKALTYLTICVLATLLVLIRVFEQQLFYDPFLAFFQNDYLYIDSPRREVFKLTAFTSLRFLLNTVLSLGILFAIFKDVSVLKFSALIYGVAYVILILLFLYFVINPKQDDYYLFFNTRRFLIQPLILLLLIPAFFYHKKNA
ncbi:MULTISPECIES: exosortase F system-associated membrane protein [Bizionia]|uniref:Exosortase F system-associated protein n=1 Tax=Bizionia algoritergicola TaxID=291187 RepID=A0A5D0R2B1_9FLAO|nr:MULTISPECIES: exosortase F system-associated protein [Bizionia]OBX23934.1 exosortase F system-associated protein [Bizionia sp. APA-3]TYB75627.1 exosortase F system-associated protein [Bizionia algoritergicola]